MAGRNPKHHQTFVLRQILYFVIPILLAITLTSCPSEKCVEDDFGLLDESLCLKIPYQDGEIYYFKHSGGKIIPFTATRQVKSKTVEEYHKFSCYRYTYETDETVLEPDYPIPTISLSVSSNYHIVSIYHGHSNFEYSDSSYIPVIFRDTLWIDSIQYTDVKVLKSYSWREAPDYADSLYYNSDHGILKILMKYGEYYTLYK
jgi:hypothetical protein